MSKPSRTARERKVLNTRKYSGRARKKPKRCQVRQTLFTGGRCR